MLVGEEARAGVRAAAGGVLVGGRPARRPRLLPAGSVCALSASGGGPCAWHGRGSEGRGTGSRPCGYACGCSSSGGGCGRGTPSHRRSTSPSPRPQPPRRRLPATQHHSAAPPDTRPTTPTQGEAQLLPPAIMRVPHASLHILLAATHHRVGQPLLATFLKK